MMQEAFYRGTVKAPRFSLHECELLVLSIIYIHSGTELMTHFKFEYCAGVIDCRGWREGPVERTPFHMISCNGVLKCVTCVRSFSNITWPAQLPNLTVPDFFLWGFLKGRVFQRHIMTIQELKQATVDEVAAIDEDLWRRVYSNFQTRLQQCIDVNGGHLLNVQKISL